MFFHVSPPRPDAGGVGGRLTQLFTESVNVFRCLGRLVFLVAIVVLAGYAYCRFTPADEFFRARALMELRQYAQAAQWFETGIRRHPDSSMCLEARYDLGQCYYRMGKPVEAARVLQEAIEKDRGNPRAPEAQMLVGKCLAGSGRKDEALKVFSTLRERYPENTRLAAEAEYLIAGMYLEKGDLPAAKRHALLVVDKYPHDRFAPRCQLMVGDILMKKKAYDRAAKSYEETAKRYPGTKEAAEAEFRLARIHYEQRAYKKSLKALTRALTASKDAHVLNTKLARDIRHLVSLATERLAGRDAEPVSDRP